MGGGEELKVRSLSNLAYHRENFDNAVKREYFVALSHRQSPGQKKQYKRPIPDSRVPFSSAELLPQERQRPWKKKIRHLTHERGKKRGI